MGKMKLNQWQGLSLFIGALLVAFPIVAFSGTIVLGILIVNGLIEVFS